MGTKCKKCDYERQYNEIVPDHTCPSCGVVYAKYEIWLKRQRSNDTIQQTKDTTTSNLQIVCRSCKKNISSQVEICPHCRGSDISVTCKMCGNLFPKVAKFCPNCGVTRTEIKKGNGGELRKFPFQSFWEMVIGLAFLPIFIVILAVLALVIRFSIQSRIDGPGLTPMGAKFMLFFWFIALGGFGGFGGFGIQKRDFFVGRMGIRHYEKKLRIRRDSDSLTQAGLLLKKYPWNYNDEKKGQDYLDEAAKKSNIYRK